MENFDYYHQKAIDAQNENNFLFATLMYSKCLEIDKKNTALLSNRGSCYYRLNLFEKAINDYTEAISYEESNLYFYYNRGIAYRAINAYDEAINDFMYIKKYDASFHDTNKIIEQLNSLRPEISISLEFLAENLEDNGDPVIAFNAGNLFQENGDFVNAIKRYSTVIMSNASYVNAYLKRAECFLNLEQFDKAIEDYITADKYILEKDVTKIYICRIYARIHQFELALSYVNQAIEINPFNFSHYHLRGIYNSFLKKPDSAIFDFTKSLQLNANHEEAFYNRAQVYFNEKRFSEAKRDFEILVRNNPNKAEYRFGLGICLFVEKDFHNSRSELLTAQLLGSNDATDFLNTNFSNY